MGYSTDFTGNVTVTPPLNGPEMAFLRKFAADDHRNQRGTPEYGYYCSWVPTPDGLGIEWSGMEKFYAADEWMQFLIDTFLKPGATLQAALADGTATDPMYQHFTFDHIVSGRIEAQGHDADDRWTLAVEDNIVTKVPYPTLAERMSTEPDLAAAFEVLKAAGVTVEQYAKQTGQDY